MCERERGAEGGQKTEKEKDREEEKRRYERERERKTEFGPGKCAALDRT